ncbi:MAG TPA: YceI family protein [Chitinophagaceae bacterium]|nr:YceI family protein [Chitinophagaceae bacterium]
MATATVNTKTKWVIDNAHSEIGFRVKHLMISNVRGAFKEYSANVVSENDDFSNAKVEATINPASVDTHDSGRDGHLAGADFFDVEKFKEIKFTSTNVKKVDDNNYKISGDLTIKGVTKPVELNAEFGGIVKDPWGNAKAAFNVTGKINRKNWGLNWNAALETGGVLVSDDVWINADVQLKKEA